MLRQFVRYAAAGAAGTLLQYAILFLLVEAAGAGALAASTCGAIAGAVVNYLLNYRYTFGSARPHREAASRYVAVSVAGIAVNGGVIAIAAHVLGSHYLVAQVLASAVVLIFAFLVNRLWTF
jgi:putative flippase GtrA